VSVPKAPSKWEWANVPGFPKKSNWQIGY